MAGLTGLAGLYGGYISAGQNTQNLYQQELTAEGKEAFGKAIQAAQLGTGGTPASVAGTTMGGNAPVGTWSGPPGQPETYAGMSSPTIGAPSLGAAAPGGAPPGTPIATGGAPAPGGPSSAGSPGVPGAGPPMGVPYAIGPGATAPPSPYGPTGGAGASGGGPSPAAGGGGYPLPAGTPAGGGADLQSIIGMIVKANPNAKPAVIAEAVNQAIPLMNAQAMAQWRAMQPQIQAANIAERYYAIDQMNKRFSEGLADKDKLAADKADLQRELNQSKLDAAMARQQAGIASKEDLELLRQAGMDRRAAAGRESREGIAAAKIAEEDKKRNVQNQALEQFKREHPGASSEQVAEFLRSLKPATAGALKVQQQAQQAGELQIQISGMIKTLDKAIADPSNSVTGIGGKVKKGIEWLQGITGDTSDTTATQYAGAMRLLQSELPRVIAGTSRLSRDEREHLEQILPSLGTFTSPVQAKNNLLYINSVLQRIKERESGTPALSGGAQPGARGVTTERVTPAQTPEASAGASGGPPASVLKQGVDTRVRNKATGQEEVWTLDANGEPIQVMNAR